MTNKTISFNDIKYDLLKIIEPWDGIVERGNPRPVRKLFIAYLNDLQKEKLIYDYSIDVTENGSFTFDLSIKMSPSRSPKRLKIHVGTFQEPWIKKTA